MFRSALMALVVFGTVTAIAGPPARYPRVYGWTGTPYGPTQAHYQYERQYGRPWHGYGGISARSRSIRITGYSPAILGGYGYSGFGWPGCGLSGYGLTGYGLTGYGYTSVFAPQAYQFTTIGPTLQFHAGPTATYVGALPDWNAIPVHPTNAAMQRFLLEEQQRWHEPIPDRPTVVERPLPRSSAAARLKSVEQLALGDADFRAQRYPQAYTKYKAAMRHANELAEPHFRMGFTLAAMGHYSRATEFLRLGLRRDSNWPLTGESLRTVYGPDNRAALNVHLQQIADWVREDIRDPERLFLLGVYLYFDEKPSESAVCFETALRLTGEGEYLQQFLSAARDPLPGGSDPVSIEQPQPDAQPPGGRPVDGPVLPPPPQPALDVPEASSLDATSGESADPFVVPPAPAP